LTIANVRGLMQREVVMFEYIDLMWQPMLYYVCEVRMGQLSLP